MSKDSDMTRTRWWWVRHAPVVGHGGRIYGQDDVPCDVSDTDSFAALARALPEGAVWVTSHLSRTTDTANAIKAAGLNGARPIVEETLAEQHFGDWQDLSWDELRATKGERYETFWRRPADERPPGGESFADVIGRTTETVRRLTGDHGGRDIIAVTHGGTIRAAVAYALDLDPARALTVKVDNLSITQIDHYAEQRFKGVGGHWRVAGINLPPI
ncbi:MAG: histidine phosphatase family protein [Rhodospirillales bacterium]|nr:histidine phosphatase family protein [Rhodospirillales bacterium]